MKKLLFCAGILALAASCTEDELVSTSMQQQAAATEGITFTATTNSPATRGEFVNVDGSYVPFWSSDPGTTGEDKISVFSKLTDKNSTNWGTSAVTYKATKSQRRGEFTGESSTDILTFIDGVDAENPAQFLTIFPAHTSNTLADNTGTTGTVTATIILGSTGAADLTNQIQTNTKGAGVFKNNMMYSATTGYPRTGEYGESIAGVGENLNLNFEYVFSGIAFSFKNVKNDDVDYTSYLGKLTQISLESLGKVKGEEYDNTKKSTFIHAASGASVAVTAAYNPLTKTMAAEAEITKGTATSTGTVKLGDATPTGLDWDDDAHAYLMVLPVERTAAEGFEVIYKFANTAFSKELPTSKSWPAGMFTNFPALDIESYDYFLTYDNTNYTLIVNKNGLAKAIKDGKVEWDIDGENGIEADEKIAIASIQNVVINGDMNAADWTALTGFTGIVELTLNDVTTIPANGFAGLAAATVKKLNLPKVTTIDPQFRGQAGAFSALTDLNLASYQFPTDAINAVFFNDDVAGELETLDISGVTSMAPDFNVNRTLRFQNYTALTTVKANPTKVVASQYAFDGCTVLESVTGIFDLGNASYAFRNAGKTPAGTDKLTKVNVATDVIPANAFQGASNVKEILLDGKQVAPTTIGEYALAGTAIEYMDLSKATTIGQSALANTSSYKGVEKNNPLVEINAVVLEDCILQGTSVVNVRFNNATKLNGNIFNAVSTLSQVKFVKAFTIDKKLATGTFTWNDAFGSNVGNVDLFINPEQEYLSADGTSLVFPYYNDKGEVDSSKAAATYKFGQVTLE